MRKRVPKTEVEKMVNIFVTETGIVKTKQIEDTIKNILSLYSAPKKEKIVEIEKFYYKDTGEEISYETINAVISLFEPFLPHEFIGEGAYAKKPLRRAIATVLEQHTLTEINTIIQQFFVIRRTEQFRPTVGTIYEFCTSKFAKIQDFLNKKNGTRYGLNNIPGEVPGEFNNKHKNTLEKIKKDKERVNSDFNKKIGLTNDQQ